MGIFFLVLIIGFWVLIGIRIVRQQTASIVEMLGKYRRTLHAGLNWIPVPFSSVVGSVSLRIIEVQAPVEVKTVDNVFVTMPMVLMIKVVAGKEADAFYKLQSPEAQIKTWVLNTVRQAVNQMKLDELFSDRSKIEKHVREDISAQLAEYGYELVNLLVEQPTVSTELQNAFNRVVASERAKEAAVLEGDAQRIKIVKAAEAESESQVARAKGIAEARRLIADAYAESIRNLTEKAPEADVSQLMELLITANRIDAMRDIGRNGNLILMDTADPQKALLGLLARQGGQSLPGSSTPPENP